MTLDTVCAVVIADQDSLSIPGGPNTGRISEILVADDGFTLLTGRGIIELDKDFRQLHTYKFDYSYANYVNFIHVQDELHIVAQKWKGLFFERYNIHLLRYGESSPLRTWHCGTRCSQPRIANFFDHENPVMIWTNLRKRRQYVRVVQLGTEREWKLDSSGFDPVVRRIGLWDESKGLQDIFIDLKVVKFRWGKVPEERWIKTIRLSDLNLLEQSPKHLNEYEGVPVGRSFESPTPGYQPLNISSVSREIPHTRFDADPKAREAKISINTAKRGKSSPEDENRQLWWKVKTQYGVKIHYRTYHPDALSCRSNSGEPFDSYLLIAIGGTCWSTCGSTIYELRPGGFWRGVYHTPTGQTNFKIDLNRKDHFHLAYSDHIIRLDRGIDYCVEDLDQFQPSLP